MRVKVDLTITNPTILNNFCKSLTDFKVKYHPQGDTLCASPIIILFQYSLNQLNILLLIYDKHFLFVIYYLCVSKTTTCRIYKCANWVVLRYCSKFCSSSTSLLHFRLARNVFYLFPYNFTQVCFSFIKKTLCFFSWFLVVIPLILFL